MRCTAKARYIRYSPYKLRPLADVVRGKDVDYALGWLATEANQRAIPLRKVIESAVANIKQREENTESLFVSDIRVDQGPIHRYYKPGAMGRSRVLRKRLCHVSVTLQQKISSDLRKKKD